jgi:hypothetical protein
MTVDNKRRILDSMDYDVEGLSDEEILELYEEEIAQ